MKFQESSAAQHILEAVRTGQITYWKNIRTANIRSKNAIHCVQNMHPVLAFFCTHLEKDVLSTKMVALKVTNQIILTIL